MKKLPKIYECCEDKKFDNNKKICYVEESKNQILSEKYMSCDDVNNVLDEIFSGFGHPYNIYVHIETDNKVYDTFLFLKTKTSVITVKNDVILIDSIKYIEKKNARFQK